MPNLPTILIAGLIFLAFAAIVARGVKNAFGRSRSGGCPGGCAGCPGCGCGKPAGKHSPSP